MAVYRSKFSRPQQRPMQRPPPRPMARPMQPPRVDVRTQAPSFKTTSKTPKGKISELLKKFAPSAKMALIAGAKSLAASGKLDKDSLKQAAIEAVRATPRGNKALAMSKDVKKMFSR